MYFAYSWPKVLSAPGAHGQYISVHLDQTHFVVVSEWSVQVWSAGHVRLRLGQHVLSVTEAEQYGQHVSATWSTERSCLAVLTSQGWLLIYHLHTSKDPIIPRSSSSSSGSSAEFLQSYCHTDVYIKHSVPCQHDAAATCIVGDARSILLAYADGFAGSCTWAGKMRSELFDILPPDTAADQHTAAAAAAADGDDYQQQQQQQHRQLPGSAVTQMHFSASARLLSMVFADGSAALYGPGSSSSSSSSSSSEGHLSGQCGFTRWLCGPAARATQVHIAPEAQLIAVGTDTGAVHLIKLHTQQTQSTAAAAAVGSSSSSGMQPSADLNNSSSSGSDATHLTIKTRSDPVQQQQQQQHYITSSSSSSAAWHQGLDPDQIVRTLDLSDWGHTAAQTGSVAALAWAPDCRALAVGFSNHGLVVWTPSGCRLICTLRQPVADTPRPAAAAAAGGGGSSVVDRDCDRQLAEGAGSSSSSSGRTGQQSGLISVDGGVSCLAWGVGGYQLLIAGRPTAAAAETDGSSSSSGILYELSLAKSLRHHHRVSHVAAAAAAAGVALLGEELHVLQAADRLLLITEALTSAGPSSSFLDPSDNAAASSSDLQLHHVLLPAAYLAAAAPISHVCVSGEGADIAVAGRQGLAVYSRRQEKWRLFGDVTQERRISAVSLGWMQDLVVACSCSIFSGTDGPQPLPAAAAAAASAAAAAAVAAAAASGVDLHRGKGAGFRCQLLLFPKTHLDFSSVVASYTLSKVPLAMDCTGQHILVVSAPLQLLLLQLDCGSSSGGSSSSSRRLIAVRELSMFNVGRPVCDITLVSAPPAAAAADRPGSSSSTRSMAAAAASSSSSSPWHAVLLRWGGLMSILDLSQGSELILSDEIESYWLSDTLPVLPAAAAAAAAAGSSRAGSTSASTSHSRTSSVQNLAVLGGSSSNVDQGQQQQQQQQDRTSTHSSTTTPIPAAAAAAAAAGGGGGRDWGAAEAAVGGSSSLAAANGEVPEVVEMPWWAYGPGGMQLWFPSAVLAAMQAHNGTAAAAAAAGSSSSYLHSQALLPAQLSPRSTMSTPRSPAAAAAAGAAAGINHAQSLDHHKLAAAAACVDGSSSSSTEMELEFDLEVYPIGVSLADSSIVGVTQRVLRPQFSGAASAQYAEGYGCKQDKEQSRIWSERARLRGYQMVGVYDAI